MQPIYKVMQNPVLLFYPNKELKLLFTLFISAAPYSGWYLNQNYKMFYASLNYKVI